MWRYGLGTAALIALTTPAFPADMRAPARKAPAVPAWSWSGCYIGGHTGGLWAEHNDWTVRTPGGDFYGEALGRHGAGSLIGGVQAGCDYQWAGGWVIGVRGDHAWANALGSHDSTREIGVAYLSRGASLSTVTGRAGYAWDRLLGYVTGGATWQSNRYSATTIILGTAYVARETHLGWTIGAGAEYAFTNALSGFIEYSFNDFGTHTVSLTPQVPGLRQGFVDITETTSVVRLGLNLRFGYGSHLVPSP